MLLSNAYLPDPRVEMEATILRDLGYEVTIFCWDREGSQKPNENKDRILIKRTNVKATYGEGMKQLKSMIVFWINIFREIKIGKYNIVHAHDFDTLPPAFLGSKIFGKKLIYDAHELYPEMISFHVPRWVVRLISIMEKLLVKRVDGLITVGQRLADYYKKIRRNNVEVIGNYKNFYDEQVVKRNREAVREKLGIPQNALVVGYIGGFSKDRAIIPLVKAVKGLSDKNVYLMLGGKGEQLEDIQTNIQDNIIYLGYVNSKEISYYLSGVDLVYYGLYPDFSNNYYSTPNSLFNALSVGKPLITTSVGEISEIVSKEKIGYVVNSNNIEEELKILLNRLSDEKQELSLLKENCLLVGKDKYSLNTNKKRLMKLYDSINNMEMKGK